MTDKIELTREKLREKLIAAKTSGLCFSLNEVALFESLFFGPKKPREWTMQVHGEFLVDCDKGHHDCKTIRVREVLENE